MARLLGLRIQNYKALADVSIGQVGYGQGTPLPLLSCFIGPNGSGKSTLLDAFGFMADCLREGVEAACDKPQRNGFAKLRTQGCFDPIRFELYYRESQQSRPITYSFAVDELAGVPVVVEETLRQRRKGQKHGRPFPFLRLEKGEGRVWAGDATEDEEGATSLDVGLDDVGRLGITTLGQLKEHPRIVGLRSYIENWYLSYFVPDAARSLPTAGAQKHLTRSGENLGNVVQYLERTHPDSFQKVLNGIARKIPGVHSISHEKSPDGRLLLQFNEQGYKDPFYQQSMSDGTLKMFAYLILLEELAREFIRHSEENQDRTQVFITTHSPYFVDALRPDQVWLMEKDEEGVTQVRRTADIPVVKAMIDEGIPLGSLWYSNHFDERFPR